MAGPGFGHIDTHTALPPGNFRNLRSEVLRWGYPLSSDIRQLQCMIFQHNVCALDAYVIITRKVLCNILYSNLSKTS